MKEIKTRVKTLQCYDRQRPRKVLLFGVAWRCYARVKCWTNFPTMIRTS